MSWLRRYPIVLFIFLAYFFAWLNALFPNPLFAILGVASPTLAVILVLLWLQEEDSPNPLKALLQWRTKPVWAIIAILGPIILALASAGILLSFSNGSPNLLASIPWAVFPAILVGRLLTNVWEEVGWRGFALPRLQSKTNGLTASLIIGIFWGFWHLPLYFGEVSDQAQLPFFLLLLDTILISVVYTLIYNYTHGSLLYVTLFHAIGNTVNALFIEAGAPIVEYFIIHLIIILIVDVGIVAVFGTRLGQERLTASPAPS